MDFAEAITRAAGLFQGFTAQKSADGEITDAELDQMEGELDEFKAAIECERAKRQAAYDTAGGPGAGACTNRTQRAATADSAADYVDKLEI